MLMEVSYGGTQILVFMTRELFPLNGNDDISTVTQLPHLVLGAHTELVPNVF